MTQHPSTAPAAVIDQRLSLDPQRAIEFVDPQRQSTAVRTAALPGDAEGREAELVSVLVRSIRERERRAALERMREGKRRARARKADVL
jgi:hypothetical protein